MHPDWKKSEIYIRTEDRFLGLDSRDLLEMMLDIAPEGIFIPAHILDASLFRTWREIRI